jgi:hypothetical protein
LRGALLGLLIESNPGPILVKPWVFNGNSPGNHGSMDCFGKIEGKIDEHLEETRDLWEWILGRAPSMKCT